MLSGIVALDENSVLGGEESFLGIPGIGEIMCDEPRSYDFHFGE